MRRILIALGLLASLAAPAVAGGPKFGTSGGVGSSSSTFSGGEPTGGSYSINGVTGYAKFPTINVFTATPPTSPANGDLWITSTGVFGRFNGSNVNLGTPSVSLAPLAASLGAL